MLVIFDFGGTLVRLKKPESELLEEVFRELSERRDVGVNAIRKAYREVFEPYERRRNARHVEVFSRALRRSFVRRLTDASEDEIRLAHAIVVKKRQEYTEPYEDALEALKAVKALGHKTALLSNATYHDAVIASLDYHDLLKYIDHPYTSASLGIRKPHPRAFVLAARLSGFEPSEAVMVGDDPYKDYLGATSAGLKAILVDRSGKLKNAVDDLRKIVPLLSRARFSCARFPSLAPRRSDP